MLSSYHLRLVQKILEKNVKKGNILLMQLMFLEWTHVIFKFFVLTDFWFFFKRQQNVPREIIHEFPSLQLFLSWPLSKSIFFSFWGRKSDSYHLPQPRKKYEERTNKGCFHLAINQLLIVLLSNLYKLGGVGVGEILRNIPKGFMLIKACVIQKKKKGKPEKRQPTGGLECCPPRGLKRNGFPR